MPLRGGSWSISLALVLASLIMVPGMSYAAVAPGFATSTNPPPAIPPKAVFADNLPTGRDPFFPDSTRVARGQGQAGNTNVITPAPSLSSQLVLKGISSGKQRRLAIINNVTLAEGETKVPIRLDSETVVVNCLEVRDYSVKISLEGSKEVIELRLRKGF